MPSHIPVDLSDGPAEGQAADDDSTMQPLVESAAGVGSMSSSDDDTACRMWYKSVDRSGSDGESSDREDAEWDPYQEFQEAAEPSREPLQEEVQRPEPTGSSKKRRKIKRTEPGDWDWLDISFKQPETLADALVGAKVHVVEVKAHGLWLWKVQFATMLTEERHKLEMDIHEQVQGRNMAECIRIFRRVLQESEAEKFRKFLCNFLQKQMSTSS